MPELDYKLEQLINGPAGTQPALDVVMQAAASWGEPLFIALVVGWLALGWLYGRREDRLGALAALAAAGAALAANVITSHIWMRPRPFVDHPASVHLLLSHTRDASFPSDHAAAGFAIGVVLLQGHRRLGAVALGLAALMSYARIYVGDHYPGDVLAGALIGVLSGTTLVRLAAGLRGRLLHERFI